MNNYEPPLLEKLLFWIKNKRFLSIALLFGIATIALSNFLESMVEIYQYWDESIGKKQELNAQITEKYDAQLMQFGLELEVANDSDSVRTISKVIVESRWIDQRNEPLYSEKMLGLVQGGHKIEPGDLAKYKVMWTCSEFGSFLNVPKNFDLISQGKASRYRFDGLFIAVFSGSKEIFRKSVSLVPQAILKNDAPLCTEYWENA
ncbi:MAG: hypothetical protein AB2689_28070 [Candidatus Thiodiazotropha taylori]